MPDGRSIVVSGLSESGVSDLYRVHLPDGKLEPLTADRYQDLDPSPGPDGRRIVFASDRTADGLEGAANLFLLDLDSARVTQLTAGPGWTSRPTGRTGRPDLLHLRPRRRAERLLGGYPGRRAAGDLRLERRLRRRAAAGRLGLLVGGFHDLSWNLYRYPVDTVARQERFSLARPDAATAGAGLAAGDTAGSLIASREPYKSQDDPRLRGRRRGLDPGLRRGAGVLLRRRATCLATTSSSARSAPSRVASSAASSPTSAPTSIYVNRSRRVNWGIGAFRTRGRNFEGDRVVAYDETAYGGLGLLRYPLSRFTRLEGNFVFEHSDRVDFTLAVDEPRRVGWIASHYLSYVHDNSLWVNSGPIDGGRFSVTGGLSSDFTNSPLRQLSGKRRLAALFPTGSADAPGRSAGSASTAGATVRDGSTSAGPSACAAIRSSATSSAPGPGW